MWKQISRFVLFKPAPRINQTQPKRQILLLDDLSKYSHRHGLKFYELRWAGTLLSRAEVGSAGSHTWISPPVNTWAHVKVWLVWRKFQLRTIQHGSFLRLSVRMTVRNVRYPGCISEEEDASVDHVVITMATRLIGICLSQKQRKKTHIQVGKIYKIRT